MAHEAWVAANRPAERPREPTLRERVRSPWFWLSLLALVALFAVRVVADVHGWASAALWIAYLGVIWLSPVLERRQLGSRP
jgi:hypothetical protein